MYYYAVSHYAIGDCKFNSSHFITGTTLPISMQSLGEIELRAPVVEVKIAVFMSRLVCLCVGGGVVQTRIV